MSALTIIFAAAISVGPRAPLALGVIAPSGDTGRTSLSALVDAVARTLEETTDLSASPFDAAIIRECAGNLGCVVSRVDPAAPYVLLISVLTEEGAPDRLSVVAVDAARARAIAAERVDEEAVLVERVKQGIEREEDAVAFVRALLTQEMRAPLERAGHWRPFGELIIESDAIGAAILIDGRAVGAIGGASTRIVDLKRGPHQVAIEHASVREVEIGEAPVKLEAYLIQRPAESSASIARSATLWSGAGLAVAGAVISAVAIAKAGSGASGVCLHGASAECDAGRENVRSGFDGGDAPSFADLNRGVPLAPIGVGLIATGALWTLGALLFEREDGVPWISIASGIAVGLGLGLGLGI